MCCFVFLSLHKGYKTPQKSLFNAHARKQRTVSGVKWSGVKRLLTRSTFREIPESVSCMLRLLDRFTRFIDYYLYIAFYCLFLLFFSLFTFSLRTVMRQSHMHYTVNYISSIAHLVITNKKKVVGKTSVGQMRSMKGACLGGSLCSRNMR